MKKYQQEIEELRRLLEEGSDGSSGEDGGVEDDGDQLNGDLELEPNGVTIRRSRPKAASENNLEEMKLKIESERKRLKVRHFVIVPDKI
jgi:hypothetical protein